MQIRHLPRHCCPVLDNVDNIRLASLEYYTMSMLPIMYLIGHTKYNTNYTGYYNTHTIYNTYNTYNAYNTYNTEYDNVGNA